MINVLKQEYNVGFAKAKMVSLEMWKHQRRTSFKRIPSRTIMWMHGTEDTTENKMVCQEGNNMHNLLDENEKDWEEIVAIYKNKRK